MKKYISLVLIFSCMLALASCASKPDNTTDIIEFSEVQGLVLLKGYTAEQIKADISGNARDTIIESWGEPNGHLSGFWGDIWTLDEESGQYITLYYDADGHIEEVVIGNFEQNAVAGNITFYEEPVKEAQNSGGTVTVQLCRDLNDEQADTLKDILDDVDERVDDHSVDRLAYYFDGDFELSDREHKYYFTYEYNVIYYDHYFAEIPAEDMQYIKNLGVECVELPDVEPTE